MIVTRRSLLAAGGGIVCAALATRPAPAAGRVVEIEMRGKDDGAHVWFDPIGIRVEPGQACRWTNRDPGNAHTVTCYHPALHGRPLRIPPQAAAWDSDYLMPDESFTVTLSVPGVYDYYCVPHEHAGMVGRIVVGTPPPMAPVPASASLTPLPAVALNGFPPVEEIMLKGIVRRA